MTNQFDLFNQPAKPEMDAGELETMLRTLKGRDWLTRRQLEQETNFNDRTIRALANASDGQIISGQRGYKLTREATIEEIKHAANWLKHQAAEMQRRAIAIERQRHA